MSELGQLLKAAADGGSVLTYLLSTEEERVMREITGLAGELELPLRTWGCLGGFTDDGSCPEPTAALRLIIRDEADGIYVLRDLDAFMTDPSVLRGLRDAFYAVSARNARQFIFVTAAEMRIPQCLQKEMYLIEVPPPEEPEIRQVLVNLETRHPEMSIPQEAVTEVALALKGLTETEMRSLMNRVLRHEVTAKDQLLDEIFLEKKQIVKKSGFLEFSPPRWTIDGIGGLDNLKDWLNRRQHMFSQRAVDAGVPVPKGLLVMGISGCGKSLAVKTISSLWNIPMFRLDMNLVFSGMYGSPEEAFHRALRTIESVAPAVLWVDEIENALGIEEEGIQIASHIFSSFLTWMQEKPPMIFIAATANRIQALPAEIIRKGRFDEVFFCDLPTEEERKEIFGIHLKRNGANVEDYDFKMLAIMTEGWNGAEIEQAVISARTDAYFENRPFNERDLTNNISRIVPLSDTMETQIKAIRSWAFSRATPASKYGKARRR